MTQTELIQQTMRRMAWWGVTEVCLAAGARNAPLVAALADSRSVRCWSFFEERCAGFFALGRIVATERPVAVVTTSGTAAAELLPAVIEAFYQGLPLLVITADRPRRYRGSGAPQAIEQAGLFGPYVSECLDWEAGDAAREDVDWERRRPLHVNLCLDEPLDPVPGIDFAAEAAAAAEPKEGAESVPLSTLLEANRPTIVLAGGLSRNQAQMAARWIEASGLPVIAEATANLGRGTATGWRGGDALLEELDVEQVVRIGGVPSWRWWRDLETRAEIKVVNISSTGFSGLARESAVVDFGALRENAGVWVSATGADLSERKGLALDRLLSDHPLSEVAWVSRVADSVPVGGLLMVGNSLPIRELSLVRVPAGIEVIASRGANGIDGQVSTFLGASVDRPEAWLLVGDLTALYDLAAPWILSQMPGGRRRIVVMHNGGGRIFSRVKSLRALSPSVRGQIENRHSIEFRGWAEMWRMPFRQVKSPKELSELPERDCLIELRPNEAQSEVFWEEWAKV